MRKQAACLSTDNRKGHTVKLHAAAERAGARSMPAGNMQRQVSLSKEWAQLHQFTRPHKICCGVDKDMIVSGRNGPVPSLNIPRQHFLLRLKTEVQKKTSPLKSADDPHFSC